MTALVRPESGLPKEEKVFLSDGGGTDGIFDEVVVGFQPPVFELETKGFPAFERVV